MADSNQSNETESVKNEDPYLNMWFTKLECQVIAYFLFTCAVLGSLLNVLVASVYIQKKTKCTYEIFILFLAFINLGGCSGLISVDYWFVFSSYETCNTPPDLTTQLTMFAECASVLMLLNIAIDRYLSIRWAVHQLMTPKRAYIMCSCAIFVASSVACLPGFLSTDSKWTLKLHLYYPCVTGLVFVLICVLYMLVFCTVNSSARKARAKRHIAHKLLNVALDPQEANASSPKSCKRSALKSKSTRHPPEKNPNQLEDDDNEEHKQGCSSEDAKTAVKVKYTLSGENEGTQGASKSRGVVLHQGGNHVKMEEKKPIELMRDRTVIILLFVFGTYALCFIPNTILNLVFYLKSELFMYTDVNTARFYKSLQLLYYLNFVLTTFVYSILSHNFREDTVKFYRRLQLPNCKNVFTRKSTPDNAAVTSPETEFSKSVRLRHMDRRDTTHSCVWIQNFSSVKEETPKPLKVQTSSV